MDMLRRCRDQFAGYAREHRAVERNRWAPPFLKAEHKLAAEADERLVAEIDATLKEWG